MLKNLSSAAVMMGALRVKYFLTLSIPPICFCLENVCLIFMSAAKIQVYLRLDFKMETNNMTILLSRLLRT